MGPASGVAENGRWAIGAWHARRTVGAEACQRIRRGHGGGATGIAAAVAMVVHSQIRRSRCASTAMVTARLHGARPWSFMAVPCHGERSGLPTAASIRSSKTPFENSADGGFDSEFEIRVRRLKFEAGSPGFEFRVLRFELPV